MLSRYFESWQGRVHTRKISESGSSSREEPPLDSGMEDARSPAGRLSQFITITVSGTAPTAPQIKNGKNAIPTLHTKKETTSKSVPVTP